MGTLAPWPTVVDMPSPRKVFLRRRMSLQVTQSFQSRSESLPSPYQRESGQLLLTTTLDLEFIA